MGDRGMQLFYFSVGFFFRFRLYLFWRNKCNLGKSAPPALYARGAGRGGPTSVYFSVGLLSFRVAFFRRNKCNIGKRAPPASYERGPGGDGGFAHATFSSFLSFFLHFGLYLFRRNKCNFGQINTPRKKWKIDRAKWGIATYKGAG